MKKTLTINLNGLVFNIDEDAFDKLNDYLKDIRNHFSNEESGEIMTDIEARIAELLNDRLKNNRNVVTMEDIDAIVSILGDPSQFNNDDAEGEERERTRTTKEERRKNRRFYRDQSNAMLGGVASGLAAYTNWDVTLIRILMVVFIFIGYGWPIPIYIILWLITPEAKTAAQRLEMHGEKPTLENIRNYLNSEEFQKSAENMGGTMLVISRSIVRVISVIVGIILSVVCMAIFIGAVVVTICVIVGVSIPFLPLIPMELSAGLVNSIILSGLLTVGIPIIALTAACFHLASDSQKKRNGKWAWAGFAIWMLSITTLLTLTLIVDKQIGYDVLESHYQNTVTKSMEIDGFHSVIASNGVQVTVSQTPEYALNIAAKEDYLDKIKCSVTDSILYITINNKRLRHNARVSVSGPVFRQLEAGSAASIGNRDTINAKHLEIRGHSAGSINLNVHTSDIEISSSSAADITIEGVCKNANVKASSGSNCDIDNLNCKWAKVAANSGSKVFVNADSLQLKATSGALIKYKGTDHYSGSADSGGRISKQN